MTSTSRRALALAALAALAACGGSSGPPPGNHDVDIVWNPNHERGVNAVGGGYRVTIDTRPEVDLPYLSGALFAPTSITTTLYTGSHTVAVRAYRPLDDAGGSTRKLSAPALLTVVVP